VAEIKGGDKLSAKLQAMAGKVTSAQSVKVGFLADKTYPDGTPVAMIAAIQNWGAPSVGIPARPFFSNMIKNKSKEWGPATGALLVANDYDAARTLNQVGEAVTRQLRESIVDTNSPPLAESTLRKRGVSGMVYDKTKPSTFGAKPLVDTGVMLDSVDYEVKT
jgi:hypothetical protein